MGAVPELGEPSTNVSTDPTRPVSSRVVDAATWGTLHQEWVSPVDADLLPVDCGRWSVFEAAVFATMIGGQSFPTVGALTNELDEPVAATIMDVVVQSFLAHGVVSAAPDGTMVLVQNDWVKTAVFPDLTIAVETNAVECPVVWFGVTPDRAVRVAAENDGCRAVHEIEPGRVVQDVVGLFASAETGVEHPEPLNLDTADVEARANSGTAFARISTSWRDGDQVVGGVFMCAVDPDGACWEVELAAGVTDQRWNMHPIVAGHGLRDLLVEHLPGQ